MYCRKISIILLVSLILILAYQKTCFASGAYQEYLDDTAQLTSVYKKLLSKITDSHQRQLLITAQNSWETYRSNNVAFFDKYYPCSKGGLFFNIHLIKERTAFLQSIINFSPGKDPTGTESSGY